MALSLPELTFCIPVRIDSAYRLRNLYAILSYLSCHVRAKFSLLEADSEQRITDLPAIDGLKYRFIKDENIIFHRTRYINRMLAETTTRMAAVWDTDVVVRVDQLIEAYRAIQEERAIMSIPYDGKCWKVDDFFSSLFKKKLNPDIFENPLFPKQLLNEYNSVGGAFLVDVRKYKECGWENEHFTGWGPEDEERFKRMHILGATPVRIPGDLYHLYHSRGINSGNAHTDTAYITKKEYCKICAMEPQELRDYIRTWEWCKGSDGE